MTVPDFYSLLEKDSGETSGNQDFYSHLEKEQPSRARSLLSAFPKGLLREAQGINPLGNFGPITRKGGEQVLQHYLPTQEKAPERMLERAGKIAPYAAIGPEGLAAKGAQLAGGVLGGEAAEAMGLGETGQSIFEAMGMAAPGLAKIGAKQAASKLFGEKKTMASGLEKPAALEAKRPGLGITTPSRQEIKLAKMDKDAARLVRETIDKRLPIAKQIEMGADFKGQYSRGFEKLKSIAENAHMEMNTEALASKLREAQARYEGIPSPNPDAKKILKEIKAFFAKPTTDHGKLLKIYRDNNNKIGRVFDTSRATGTMRQEYTDFLREMNQAIQQTFENTLPKDNIWLQQFKELNKNYKAYKDASSVLDVLKDAISHEPSLQNFEKIAIDPKVQKKLTMKAGAEAAGELIQIAKDLRMAKEAIKSVPAKEWKLWHMTFPLTALIPGIGKALGGTLGIAKIADLGRRGYGFFLTSPAKRAAYSDALRAIQQNNLPAYVKAAEALRHLMEEE